MWAGHRATEERVERRTGGKLMQVNSVRRASATVDFWRPNSPVAFESAGLRCIHNEFKATKATEKLQQSRVVGRRKEKMSREDERMENDRGVKRTGHSPKIDAFIV